MATLLLLFCIFIFVLWITKSFIVAIIATVIAVSFFEINTDELKETVQTSLETADKRMEQVDVGQGQSHRGYGPPEGPTQHLTKVTQGDAINYTTETITDKLREQDKVHVFKKQACLVERDGCFPYTIRRHNDGILYACEQLGSRCFVVSD